MFVLSRGEHPEGAVAASAVVEELDVVVDRGGELDAGLPRLAVEQFDLQAAPERFDHGIVLGAADGSHRRRQTGVADVFWLNAQEGNCADSTGRCNTGFR